MTTLDEAGFDEPRVHPPPGETGLQAAIAAARNHLLGLQAEQGWWKAELETNVTMDAEDLMLRHFLGILEPAQLAASAKWIRSNQQADGTWSTFYGGPPDLSTTVEAYLALRLAGDGADEEHMRAAAAFVRDRGGVAASRVFTRMWLALMGLWEWEDLPVLPPELMFLPPRVPLNIYDFGCWARQTVVALTIVSTERPSRPLPFDLHELGTRRPGRPPRLSLRTPAGRFLALDRLLHHYERLPRWFLPRRALRSLALAQAERWILARQEADGLWGGIQPPVVYSIIALHS
ncbi:MAG: hypothetical protein JO337_07895, partial [Acidimicrobiales bacterium]|nr:hypothetical protein [Acidimicrobiales bacterium]